MDIFKNKHAQESNKAISQKRNIRVFISSTFRDMMEERDALMTHCWPELRKFCRELQVEMVEVDLRWGIAEEQSTRKETLKLCLDEIRACRPFFIGLLGERYGWIPGDDAFTPDLKEEQPWLKGIHDKSVTELEILHGVLNNPEMAGRAFFYFRDPLYIETVPKEKKADFLSESPTDAKKQNQLKDVIRATCTKKNIQLLENYTDPQALAPIILEQLKAAIESQFPKEDIPDELTREAREHEAFAEVRRRTYIGRPEYYNQLDKHVGETGKPLLLLGDSGSGKSALVANWVEHWQKHQPNDYIFQHYIGGTNDSSDHWKLIKRLISEIKRWTDDIEELPSSNEDILRDFPVWLSKARIKANREGVKFIVIMDALNQLEDTDHAHVLGWLPVDAFRENLRLIVSTLPGDILEVLEKKELTTLLVKPLTPLERGEMITDYLLRFGKALDKPRIERLSTNKATENPLYLKIVLDELRVTGTHDQLDQRLDDYLSAVDIPALLQKVLARYQRDYEHDRKGLVSDALSMIWAARRGLTESELLRLLKTEDLEQLPLAFWSPLRAALEDSLIERNGILNFAHDFLRKAVESAFLMGQDEIDDIRIHLADLFDKNLWSEFQTYDFSSIFPMLNKENMVDKNELEQNLNKLFQYWYKVDNTVVILQISPSKRDCDELPWLLWKTDSLQRLRQCLLNVDFSTEIYENDKNELLKYWIYLGEEASIGKEYINSFEKWKKINSKKWIIPATYTLRSFLVNFGLIADADYFSKLNYQFYSEQSNVGSLDYAASLDQRADHLTKLNRYEEAESMFKESIKIYEENNNHPDITSPLNNIGLLFSKTKRFDEAEVYLKEALKINEHNFGKNHLKVAMNLLNLAEVLKRAKKLDEAEPLCRRALKIKEGFYGKESPEISINLNNLAGILLENNYWKDAEPILNRALKINEENNGKDDIKTASILTNISSMYFNTNRLEEAEKNSRRAVQIYYDYIISNSIWEQRLEDIVNNYRIILHALGKTNEEGIKVILRIAPKYFELNPKINVKIPDSFTRDKKKDINFLNLLKPKEQNEDRLRKKLKDDENKFGKNNPNVTISIYKLALFLASKNQNKEAELLMRRAINIDEDNPDKNYLAITAGLGNLGLLLKTQSRFSEAEVMMRNAVQILEDNGYSNKKEIIAPLNNLAQLLKANKQYDEAELLSRRAVLTLTSIERLTGQTLSDLQFVIEVYRGLLNEMDWDVEQIEKKIEKLHPNKKTHININENENGLKEALIIYEDSFGENHRIIVDTLFDIVKLLLDSKRIDEARPYLERAFIILASHFIEDPLTEQFKSLYIELLKELGWSDEKIHKHLYIIAPNLFKNQSNFTLKGQIDQINNLSEKAEREFEQEHYDEAIKLYQQQIQLAESILKSYPLHEENKKTFAISYNRLGEIYETAGLIYEALSNFEKSLFLQNELYESNPQNESLKNDLAIYYEKIGSIQQSLGLKDEALVSFNEYQKLSSELYCANLENTDYLESLCISFFRLANLHNDLGNIDTGRNNFDQWKENLNHLIEKSPQEPKYKEWDSIEYEPDISDANYIDEDEDQNTNLKNDSTDNNIQSEKSEEELIIELNNVKELYEANPQSNEKAENVVSSYNNLGYHYFTNKMLKQSLSCYENSLKIATKLNEENSLNPVYIKNLVLIYFNLIANKKYGFFKRMKIRNKISSLLMIMIDNNIELDDWMTKNKQLMTAWNLSKKFR
ncbi:MAG: tetratricopeptide repeat protein [Bacteroidales bacterium]